MNSRTQNITKKVLAILIMPLVMYLVMILVTSAAGKTFNIFSKPTFESLMATSVYATLVAIGVGLQLKYGRFDFAGGAIIVVTAIAAGVMANNFGLPLIVVGILCVLIGILLSVINSLIYVKFRIPIQVCSLAVSYLFESFSGLILGEKAGPMLYINDKYNKIGMFPLILIPLVIAVVVQVIYCNFTVSGKQANLLSKNQKSAVNIGINEKKNTIICYAVSGAVFGLASLVFLATNALESVTTPLSTAGQIFSNIVPCLIGLFLSRYINDVAGIFVGALTLAILYYGLNLVGVRSGAQTLWNALFLFVFVFVSGFWDQILAFVQGLFVKLKSNFKKEEKQ